MNEELIANQSAKPTVLLTKDRENRVYIAGPMTGLPEFNFPAFNTMAATMRAEGWHVENPAEHGHVEGAEWADYLRHDIGRLGTCEAVLLLPGWSKSRGALLESHIAEQLGLRVMLAEGAEPAAQHQVEPVALPDRMVAVDALNHDVPVEIHNSTVAGWNACLDAIERLGPLFTHADTGVGFSAGDMADQGAKAFRDGQRSITELTDDLREILGRPNFTCHHIAQALRQMGHTIAKKSEDEQASVIHWMLGHYLKYGPDWRQRASDELKVVSQAAE